MIRAMRKVFGELARAHKRRRLQGSRWRFERFRGAWSRESVGELPKRSNGSDCKSDGYAFTGSNPVLPTNGNVVKGGDRMRGAAGCSPSVIGHSPLRLRV